MASSTRNIPRYKKVMNCITAQIANEKFCVGQKLPTDRELASQLNVSPVTVSKAYNVLVEQGYLKRIQGAGTFVASNKKRTKKIVFLTSKSDSKWTGVILSGFTKTMSEKGYEVLVAPDFESDPIKEKAFIDSLDPDKIDGIFVFARLATEKYYLELTRNKDITVLLGGGIFRWLPYVNFDNYRIGQLAAKYLLEQGARSFAVITEDFDAGRERFYGFKEELSKKGYEIPQERVIWARQSMHLTMKEITRIINKWNPFPEGIFAHGDSYLVHLYHQYLKGMAKLDENTILVGVSNNFGYHHIPFASVDYNLYGLGKVAGEYLLELLEMPVSESLGRIQGRYPVPKLYVRKTYIKEYGDYVYAMPESETERVLLS